MTVFAVRLLLAPLFVILVSLAARRFGVRLGGVVAGLPVIAGPVLLVLALQHGTKFASDAAVGVLLGMVGLAAFVLAYVAAAKWLFWPGAVAAGYLAYGLVVVAMRPVSVGALAAFVVACASLLLTLLLAPNPHALPPAAVSAARWDLPFRAICTAAAVVTVTAAASSLGPHLSGLITSVPIITAVLAVFTQAHAGRDETTRLLRGFTTGFFSYALFCFVIATTLKPAGTAGSFLLAVAAALGVQAGAVAWSYRLVAASRAVAATPAASDVAD